MKALGGYQDTRNWGIEAAVTDFGQYHGSDAHSLSLAGTATLPLDAHWALMGKLGVTANHAQFPGASDRTDALIGIGAGYKLSKNLGLRVEYETYGKLSDPVPGFSSDKADNLSFVGIYSF